MRAKLSSQMIFLVAQAASTYFVIRNYLKFLSLLSSSPSAGIAEVHSRAWLSDASFMHARQALYQLPLEPWVLHS